jgi:hypothetical protein
MKAAADYYSLHRNLRLDFINGKPKKTVENLMSVIKPAALKISESRSLSWPTQAWTTQIYREVL